MEITTRGREYSQIFNKQQLWTITTATCTNTAPPTHGDLTDVGRSETDQVPKQDLLPPPTKCVNHICLLNKAVDQRSPSSSGLLQEDTDSEEGHSHYNRTLLKASPTSPSPANRSPQLLGPCCPAGSVCPGWSRTWSSWSSWSPSKWPMETTVGQS